ncbi:MAG: S49 family peptidase [Rhodospirillales bacterium]
MKNFMSKLPLPAVLTRRRPRVNVIRLTGVIGQAGVMRKGLTLDSLSEAIGKAFASEKISAVALQINSPGGSPVQSSLIQRRIRQLADEKKIPVYAFAEDVAASGGYWLAMAADEFYADAGSIIGSIGVVSAGFGFEEAIARLGIERRMHTAGTRKAMLDPFQKERPADVKKLKEIQADLHGLFQELVQQSRGERLKGAPKDLFSGDVWTGRQAVELGLIDGLGDLRTVMREKFGKKVRFQVVNESRGGLRRFFGGSAGPDMDLAGNALATLEERALWSRFGL